MDASRSNLCQEDVTELLSMLESSDVQTVDNVKALIHENLNGTKDVWLLHGLVDYYIAFESKHALEILVRVREPHDKHLFDKITEYVKHENTRYHCLLLLSHVVHCQPPWLHKIAHHRIFQTLLTLLKSEKDSPSLLCALFTTVCLLPIIPSQIGPYLNDIFEIFSRLASWNIKNSIGVPEIYVLHLQVGVYALFHRLYGMYPCNFLGYLRSYYGRREYNEENLCVLTNTIKPMLERVKLHPLLVTACKETELSHKRWRRMAPHDIVVECANISLDPTEATGENVHSKNSTFSSGHSGHIYPISHENSSQFVSFSSQSSTTSLTVEPNSAVNEAMNTKPDVVWSPSLVCDVSSSNQILHAPSDSGHNIKQQLSDSLSQMTLDPEPLFHDNVGDKNLEFSAVKSEPEFILIDDSFNKSTKDSNDPDGVETYQCGLSKLPNSIDIAEALEAKEEELADKEVSELTSSAPNPILHQEQLETRHDTPFCSTTQNLTDKPKFPDINLDDLTKNKEDDEQTDVILEEQAEIKMEQFVQTMNRLRYFSQCGAPSELSHEPSEKPAIVRSSSCPDITYVQTTVNTCNGIYNITSENSDEKLKSPNLSPVASTNSNPYCLTSVHCSSPFITAIPLVETKYDHLFPIAVPPMVSENVNSCSGDKSNNIKYIRCIENSSSCNFSPAELLDRHILLSNEIHLGQLSSIPLTSTKKINWTHFGGKPPPDEIMMLQTQILLLHNQLMFERHRRVIHGERNRRLLGKARRTRMQEEYTAALKDQVALLERENIDLRKQIYKLDESYGALCKEKKSLDENADSTIKKLLQDKKLLQYSNKKLQGLLVAQKQEIDVIRDAQKLGQSLIVDLEFENELLKHDIALCNKKEEDLQQLSKQNVLLHELNQLYVDRFEASKEPMVGSDTIDLIKDAASLEIKDLKQKLESKTLQIDVALSRINELETELSSLKLKILEQTQITENTTALHKDEILAWEDRLLGLKKIIHRNQSHILELRHLQENLNDEIKMVTLKLKGNLPLSNSASVSNLPSSSEACVPSLLEVTFEK